MTLLCIGGIEVHAQNRSTSTKSREFSTPDEFAVTPVKETYSYYEDESGNYIKHGSYSLVGQKDEKIVRAYKSAQQKCTFSLKANYKDGLLNGAVTASHTSTATASDRLASASLTTVLKENFSGNYVNGLPHGKWTFTRTRDGKTLTSVNINFNNGVMIGDYLVTAEANTGEIIKTQGKLDNDGFLIGKWTSVGTVTDRQENYDRGVELSRISRNTDGSTKSSSSIDPEIKEVAYKFINREATLDELSQMGYPQYITDEGKRGTLNGYSLCFSNFLRIKDLTGRMKNDMENGFYNKITDEPKIVIGRAVMFHKIGIMTDELHNAMLAKQGLNIEADSILVNNIKSGDAKNPTYFNIHTASKVRPYEYFGYTSYVELSCGEKFPLMQYYMTEDQYTRGKKMYNEYYEEKRRIEAEAAAAKKREEELIKKTRIEVQRKINSVGNYKSSDSNKKDKRKIFEYFKSISNDISWASLEECSDLDLIADNVQKILELDDVKEISIFIHEYNKYDILLNYNLPDSVAPRRAVKDTDKRREDAEKSVGNNIARNIIRDIAEITGSGFNRSYLDYRDAKEDEVLVSLKTGCNKEFLRLYMMIYNAYNRNSINDYDMMLRVNLTMKTLHSNKIKSSSNARKAAKEIQTYDDAVNFFTNDAMNLCEFNTTSSSQSSSKSSSIKVPSVAGSLMKVLR
ncbi:MAG: hypothetical protein R3Y26_08135 [Rikenellaceae bacterium]